MAGKCHATQKWFRKNQNKDSNLEFKVSDGPNEEAGGNHVGTQGSLQVEVKEYQSTQEEANVPDLPLLHQPSQEEQEEDGDNENDVMQEGGVEENLNCRYGLGVYSI